MEVSIITVNYNGSKTLSRTIESILNQTYENIEYIIVDGKSTDNSVEIIKNYEKIFEKRGYKYKWVSEKDTGIYNAMNKGVKLATGEVVGILNSDDWYEKNTISLVVDEFKNNEQIELVYGILRKVKNGEFQEIIGDYNSYGVGQHPTVFLKKEIYEKYGYFDEKYKIAADTDLLLRLKNKKIKYKFIEKILTNFSVEGISNTVFYKANLEYVDVCYKNGIYNKTSKMIKDIYIYLRYFTRKLLKI